MGESDLINLIGKVLEAVDRVEGRLAEHTSHEQTWQSNIERRLDELDSQFGHAQPIVGTMRDTITTVKGVGVVAGWLAAIGTFLGGVAYGMWHAIEWIVRHSGGK